LQSSEIEAKNFKFLDIVVRW